MTTLSLPRKRIKAFYEPIRYETQYSLYAVASIVCISLFLGFLIVYQTAALELLPKGLVILSTILSIVIMPAFALIFSVIALKRYVQLHEKVKGMVLAYISFLISALYFVTALAMPVVLLGLYAVYIYIW